MTAFGRACVISLLGRFVVEIQSVNRKHLEINTFLPKELVRFDPDVKKWISQRVVRGSINARIVFIAESVSPLTVTPNLPLVRKLRDAWQLVAEDCGFSLSSELCMRALQNEPALMLYDEDIQDEELYRQAMKQTIAEALNFLIEMKRKEGAVLQNDIALRLDAMRNGMEKIAGKAPDATERFRLKLVERLQELLPGHVENEERVLREIAVYAEKVDITEEITRFDSHIVQFLELLEAEREGVGKTLEFLVQELNREINTIGSKASDIEVTKVVIEIKSELEKIREQIQNIE